MHEVIWRTIRKCTKYGNTNIVKMLSSWACFGSGESRNISKRGLNYAFGRLEIATLRMNGASTYRTCELQTCVSCACMGDGLMDIQPIGMCLHHVIVGPLMTMLC